MEIGMGVFCTLITLLVVFNSFLLIGIAGSVAKLIRYTNDGDSKSDRDRWAQIIRQRRSLNMQEANQPTYADTVGLPQSRRIANNSSNWDGIPRGPNWDGIPKSPDDE